MLVCYLDDSGSDPQNPISTMAGFVALADEWERFEAAVEPIFAAYGIGILHTMDLHHRRNEFDGWDTSKTRELIAEICLSMSPYVLHGLSMSTLKQTYQSRANESGRKRTSTRHSFCFQWVLDQIMRGTRTGRLANTVGVSFVIEDGNNHNGDALRDFKALRTRHGLEAVLHSISVVAKDQCRAIQVADLLAYYSRRHGVAILRKPPELRIDVRDPVMDIINSHVPITSFVATDFGPDAAGSRFSAGDP